MAKRRILKKEISYVAGELFTEALVCKLYIPGVNQEKADALMARILDMQDSYIVRVKPHFDKPLPESRKYTSEENRE